MGVVAVLGVATNLSSSTSMMLLRHQHLHEGIIGHFDFPSVHVNVAYPPLIPAKMRIQRKFNLVLQIQHASKRPRGQCLNQDFRLRGMTSLDTPKFSKFA